MGFEARRAQNRPNLPMGRFGLFLCAVCAVSAVDTHKFYVRANACVALGG